MVERVRRIPFDTSILDRRVRPQDDFAAFAGGGWLKKNPIPATEARWGTFDVLRRKSQKQLHAIVQEVERVRQRKFGWTPSEVENALRAIRSWATIIEPRIQVSVIQRDKADNRILECASESEAHYLVTGDQRDLRPLKEFQGIKIVSPAEFLEILRSTC